MTDKYGSRGERYVQIEIGHAAQNIYLQVLAFGLEPLRPARSRSRREGVPYLGPGPGSACDHANRPDQMTPMT